MMSNGNIKGVLHLANLFTMLGLFRWAGEALHKGDWLAAVFYGLPAVVMALCIMAEMVNTMDEERKRK